MTPETIYDRNGYLIQPGDLVRIYHYRDRSSGRHEYMHFVVGLEAGRLFLYRWDTCITAMEAVPAFARQTRVSACVGQRGEPEFRLWTEIISFNGTHDQNSRPRNLAGVDAALERHIEEHEGDRPAGFPPKLAKRLKAMKPTTT